MNLSITTVKRLYNQGLSAKQVGEITEKTVWQVIRFMRKNNLPRRKSNETNKLQYLKKPLSYKIKKRLSPKEERLQIAGIMLYWGEGNKQDDTVDFSNSDPEMIKLFLKFLRRICGINEKKLRALIYCYSNQNLEELEKYWINLTNIPKIQFQKPYIRDNFVINKSGKMPHGLIHIRYSDKKLIYQIKNWIEKFKDSI